MSDVAKRVEVLLLGPLLLGPPMPLPGAMPMGPPRFKAPKYHNHGPGQYCFFCSCQDCLLFFGRGAPIRCFHPLTLELNRPRYSYMGLVNSMRAASAKREEDRQDKLRAEREGNDAAAAAEAPKNDKASKNQPKKKNLRRNMKRRRQ